MPITLRILCVITCLGTGVFSCSRTQTVPPISSAPELRIPPSSMPLSRDPLRIEAVPVRWSQAPWQPDKPARDWKYIVFHHTATQAGSVESIHRSHLARKDAAGNAWRGIGYHFVIGNGRGMKDGEVEATFRWRDQIEGAHAGVAAYNQSGIGICLVGNFDREPPTDAQLSSLTQLVHTLAGEYGIGPESVTRHGDLKSTSCPGRLFPMQELTQTFSEGSIEASQDE